VAYFPKWDFSYRPEIGDGEFTYKRGWPFPRYELVFEAQSLNIADAKYFEVFHLQKQESVLGISFDTRGNRSCRELKDTGIKDTEVTLKLIQNDEVVVEESSILEEWRWHSLSSLKAREDWLVDLCFVYTPELYLTPEPSAKYMLFISIDGKANIDINVRAVIKSTDIYLFIH